MTKFDKWWEANKDKVVDVPKYSRDKDVKLCELQYGKEISKFVFDQFIDYIKFLNMALECADQM